MLTIAMLAALGQHEELKLHVRATRNTGVSPEEVKEVLLQVAIYAGIPAANSAFQHDPPLDPNFTGLGRAVTNENGEYEFLTILPGAYPWRNTYNAWRPAHIHFSVFGPAFATRLVTQMYFPGDPLLALDPIYNSVPDPVARLRLVSAYDPQLNQAEYALGYRFDIVVRGRDSTPFEGRR